jgi:protein-disulfide isomerase
MAMAWGLGLALLGVFAAAPAFAQSEDAGALRREIDALREGQERIERKLLEIEGLLRGRAGAPAPAAPDPVVSVDGAPFRGERTAKVTIVEFSDYECPFCGRHFRETLGNLERDYIRPGKVRYVFRDFPLESIHPHALGAAEGAHCAGEQNAYWSMHDRLFAHQEALGSDDLREHAKALGLDVARFSSCLDSGRYQARIRQELADGIRAGIEGTPTFFIGLTEPNSGRITASAVIRGAHPYASFRQAIEKLLAAPAR